MTLIPLSRLLVDGRQEDHPVAIRDGHTIPFCQFRDDVARLAHWVQSEGIVCAGLWCEDAYAFAVGVMGLAHGGATVVMPPHAQPGFLAEIAPTWDVLLSDRPELPGALPVLGRTGEAPALAPLRAEDGLLQFFTSGSSARPKRVERPLGAFEREAFALESLLGAPGLTKIHATVPHYHVYGMTFRLSWPLTAGRPFAARHHEVWETLLPHLTPGSVLVSSPAHLTRLGGLGEGGQPALVLSAGALLPVRAALEVSHRFGVLPMDIYGSTETGAIAWRRPQHQDTPWTPFPGVTVTPQEEGVLRLTSPWVAESYDGADRIEILPTGGFHLKGRADRVVKGAGGRVSLEAVEEALRGLPGVADAAAVALPELAAVVALTPDGEAYLAERGAFRLGRWFRSQLAARLDAPARPRRWRFVTALPTSALGKHPESVLATLFEPPRRPQVTALRLMGHQVEMDLHLLTDLVWFKGHFPDFPILPGVVQLDWALGFAREHLSLDLPTGRQFQVKYKAGLFPGDRVTLRLLHAPERHRLTFTYLRAGEICSTGQIAVES